MNTRNVRGSTAFCFDLDGTITKEELLPCIASELGISDEMAMLTKATMEGHIEFEPSFRLRCLLLGGIAPEVIESIVSSVTLDPNILEFIAEKKNDCFIISGNLDIWIKSISKRCGCQTFSSTAEYVNGRLQLTNIMNKALALRKIREEMGYDRIVAIGDGANDAAMLDLADVGIAFGGVHAAAKAAVHASKYVIHDGGSLCKMLRAL